MKKYQCLMLSAALLAALLFVACTPRTFLAKPEALNPIRSVAIIGFDTYVSADIGAKLNKLMGPDLLIQTLSSGWKPNVASPIDAKGAYGVMAERLSSELGVRTLGYEEVAGSEAYAALFKKYLYEHSVGNLRVDGILSGEGARKLTVEERESLRKALGVDAVMAVELSYWVDDAGIVSEVGGERLWGRIDAVMFADGPEPIWRDEADGERTKKGLPPLVHQEALADIKIAVEEATSNALSLLFSRLHDRCPACRRTDAAAGKADEASAASPAASADVPAASEKTADDASAAASPSETSETPAGEIGGQSEAAGSGQAGE
jgi:hypothetical protein